MLRSFGLELKSLINSDTAWKVSKGSRSTPRRARKTVSTRVPCTNSEGFVMPVSETEKHGESTSGGRFSNKVENIPIKKRRFLLRSPSPPTVNVSPSAEETADHKTSQVVSEKVVTSDVILSPIVDNTDSLDAKKSDQPDERLGEDEDFSGISILAAAACSSSLGRDCGYAEDGLGIEESSVLERVHEASIKTEALTSSKALSKDDILNSSEMSSGATSSCISTEPVGELASVSTAVNSSQKAATIGKTLKSYFTTFSGDASCSKDDELARNAGLSSRDERLHWDLNVVMDAWEQPFDNLNAQNDVSLSISEDPGNVDHSDKNRNDHMVYAAQRCPQTGESSALASHNEVNHDMDACLNLEQFSVLKDKSLTSNSNLNFDIMKSTIGDTTYERHEVSVQPTDGLAVAIPDEMNQTSASCAMIKVEGTSLRSLNMNDGRSGYQSVLEDFKTNVCVPYCDLRNLGGAGVSDATFGAASANTCINLFVSSSSDTLSKLKPNVGILEDLIAPKILNQEGNDLVENVDLKTLEPQEKSKYTISDDNGLPNTEALDSMPKRSCDLQEGYDSQYEDGELRESSGRAWEEYDREAENVDHVSHYKGTDSANPSDYHVSNSVQEVDRKTGTLGVGTAVSSDDRKCNYDVYARASEAADNDKRDDEEKRDLSLGKEMLESSKRFSDMATSDADDNGRKDKMLSNHIDRSLDSRGTETRMEPREFSRGLQSQMEGPVGRDDTSRDEQIKKMNNRYQCTAGYEFEPGSMRSFERLRYSFHNQVRGRQGASWDGSSDSRRGFRRHYSPIMRGNRKLYDDGVVDRDDLGYVNFEDGAPYSQQLPKNRVGAEADSCTGFHSRFKADRKFSPDRGGGFGRGKSFMYGPFGESRGGRGRYNGPSPDETFQSSLKYRRPLSRREKSLSPFGGRGQSNIHHSRKKSPSRSRSRSPIILNSPRRRLGAGSGGGNTFHRHCSRSPNFRSEASMQRLRSPHQHTGFGVDHAGGFRPVSRNHGSPPRRWNSARKDEMGQFRELGYKQRMPALDRSPGRMPLRGDRGSGSPRNLKPDGYFRMPDRISDDVGRGVRYEENCEDRRKQYNLFRPTRRNYDDDINDSFSLPNSFRDRDASSFQDRGLRGFDNRLGDLPRRFRGENPTFTYKRNGKFNNNSKQFGLDGMDSSQNLKSDEQYRPMYNGRFSDVSGTYRGSRYEKYEDRRKHYSATNITRHTDDENTEKRLNDNENFEDTCGRGTRAIDGRIGSLLTRFSEDEELIVCGKSEKLDDNSEPAVQISGDNDATKGIVTS